MKKRKNCRGAVLLELSLILPLCVLISALVFALTHRLIEASLSWQTAYHVALTGMQSSPLNRSLDVINTMNRVADVRRSSMKGIKVTSATVDTALSSSRTDTVGFKISTNSRSVWDGKQQGIEVNVVGALLSLTLPPVGADTPTRNPSVRYDCCGKPCDPNSRTSPCPNSCITCPSSAPLNEMWRDCKVRDACS